MSVSGDSAVQSNQSTASSEITVAMTLVTVVLLREENYIAHPQGDTNQSNRTKKEKNKDDTWLSQVHSSKTLISLAMDLHLTQTKTK